MLVAIAWKNVWRNTRRSAIMMTAIALGLWGGLFAVAIFTGMYDAVVNTAIDRALGHAQVHARGPGRLVNGEVEASGMRQADDGEERRGGHVRSIGPDRCNVNAAYRISTGKTVVSRISSMTKEAELSLIHI